MRFDRAMVTRLPPAGGALTTQPSRAYLLVLLHKTG